MGQVRKQRLLLYRLRIQTRIPLHFKRPFLAHHYQAIFENVINETMDAGERKMNKESRERDQGSVARVPCWQPILACVLQEETTITLAGKTVSVETADVAY